MTTTLNFLAQLNRDQIREGWRFTLGPVGGPGFVTYKNELVGIVKKDGETFLAGVSLPSFDCGYPGPDASWDVKAETLEGVVEKVVEEYMANLQVPCERCGELVAGVDGAYNFDGETPYCGQCGSYLAGQI